MAQFEFQFENLKKAFLFLEEAVSKPPVEKRDFAGIIKAFESTYELLWKTLQTLLESNGIRAPFPRVVFEEAFKRNLLEGNEIWKEIIETRNQTVHTYDQEFSKKVVEKISKKYVSAFKKTIKKVEAGIKT